MTPVASSGPRPQSKGLLQLLSLEAADFFGGRSAAGIWRFAWHRLRPRASIKYDWQPEWLPAEFKWRWWKRLRALKQVKSLLIQARKAGRSRYSTITKLTSRVQRKLNEHQSADARRPRRIALELRDVGNQGCYVFLRKRDRVGSIGQRCDGRGCQREQEGQHSPKHVADIFPRFVLNAETASGQPEPCVVCPRPCRVSPQIEFE
jgi:hypothetical protein